MNQTQPIPVDDKQKKRREYLWTMGAAYSLFFGSGFLASCSFGVAALAALRAAIDLAFRGSPYLDGNVSPTVTEIIRSSVLPIFYGVGGGILCLCFSKSTKRKIEATRYVPSEKDHIPSLPSVEILLRSADQPIASPEELVRAATFSEATPETGLLRAADGESSKTEQRVGGDAG